MKERGLWSSSDLTFLIGTPRLLSFCHFETRPVGQEKVDAPKVVPDCVSPTSPETIGPVQVPTSMEPRVEGGVRGP